MVHDSTKTQAKTHLFVRYIELENTTGHANSDRMNKSAKLRSEQSLRETILQFDLGK